MDNSLVLSLDEISALIKARMNALLRTNLYDMNLTPREKERLSAHKKLLREHIRLCSMGKKESKEALIDFIKDGIIKIYGRDEKIPDRSWYFSGENKKTARYKFEILMYAYQKTYGTDAVIALFGEEEAAASITAEKCLSEECIERIYERKSISLGYEDKLQILSVRIYENIWGLGCIDFLRDMKIDGISGGVSGENFVWVFFKGMSVGLPFLIIKRERRKGYAGFWAGVAKAASCRKPEDIRLEIWQTGQGWL